MDRNRLKSIPLFAELSDEALGPISAFANETSVSEGTRLVQEGDYSYELMVIEEGDADVVKAGEVVGTLGPGDVFGEIGVLERGLRSADVVATSSMRLITLTSWDLKRIPDDVLDRLKELVAQRS